MRRCSRFRTGEIAMILFLLSTFGAAAQTGAPTPLEDTPPYSSFRFIQRSASLDTSGAWLNYSDPVLRFHVLTDGLHKLTRDWFQASGFTVAGVNPATIALYRKGKEIPMLAVGMDDGAFDAADYFVFAGQRNYNENGYRKVPAPDEIDDPYPSTMNLYTDSTAYWIVQGTSPSRVTAFTAPGTAADTIDWAYSLWHFEPDLEFHPLSTNTVRIQNSDWTSEDTWHEFYINEDKWRSYVFPVTALKPGYPGRLWAKVACWVSFDPESPQFRVTAGANSMPVLDSTEFDLDKQGLVTATIPPGILHEGNDTLYIHNVWLRPPLISRIVTDWFEVEFPRTLLPVGDKLSFAVDSAHGTGLRTFKILDVTTQDIAILKISPFGTTRVGNAQFLGANPYTIVFTDTAEAGVRYELSSTAAMVEPFAGSTLRVEKLRETSRQAGYLIITAKVFAAAAEEYRQFIESKYSVVARVVTVEDIYDNYSFGCFNPEAIKVFLLDARSTWTQLPPTFLLLAGDANWNYKDKTSRYVKNYVPSYGYPVSDTWFVSFDSLALRPAMSVGRLPVSTEEQFRAYLEKHRKYLTMKPDIWNKTTIHFTGGDAKKGEDAMEMLRHANLSVIGNFITPPPLGGQAYHFYKTIEPPTSFGPFSAEYIRNAIDNGGIAISYIGHSGVDTWDNGIQEASQLNNARDRSSLVTDFGCSTGKFAEPDVMSFSEKFVSYTDGQAIAYVGNSSLGFESITQALPDLFYGALIRDRISSIGEAHRFAKAEMLSRFGLSDVNSVAIRCNTLVGDPIVRIPFPTQANLVAKREWMLPATELFTDAMDSLRFAIAYWNYGTSAGDSVSVRVEDIAGGKTLSSSSVTVVVPALNDTLRLGVAAQGIVGTRTLRVTLDATSAVAESDEGDNIAELEYFVYSTHIKAVNEPITASSGSLAEIRVLNPLSDPGAIPEVAFEFDREAHFLSALSAKTAYGKTVSTLAPLSMLPAQGKWYWRASLGLGDKRYAGPYAFWRGEVVAPFLQRDSAEFSRCEKRRAIYYEDKGMSVLPPKRTLGVMSAGKFDGSYGSVLIDGFNVLKTTYFTGYAVAVFDSVSLELLRQQYFDTYNYAVAVTEFTTFLDSVKAGEIIAVTSTDEPVRRAKGLIGPLGVFGSRLIDKLANGPSYSSFGMIGWRGAALGSIPEAYSASKSGGISIDTVFTIRPDSAFIVSPPVGPAEKWRTATLRRTAVDSTVISVSVIGVDTLGAEKTLLSSPNPVSIDLSSIDASLYPMIRLAAVIAPKLSETQPAIRSWAVDYQQRAELAVNYQSVLMLTDTVSRGAPATIRIGVLNTGDADARSFPVHVDVVGEDNVRRPVLSYTVAGLSRATWHDTTVGIPTGTLARACRLLVEVDRDNAVREQFEDNNFFDTRVFVNLDTTRPLLEVLIDNAPPMNGDYVRATPQVALTLKDLSPAFVTICSDAFTVTLDDKPIPCDSSIVAFTPAAQGRDARFVFTPTLAPGDHYFTFNAADVGGNKALPEDMRVLVRVTADNALKEVYTYPNPAKGGTSFLFVLTGAQAPDGLEIKVYTVAGRMIRKMSVAPDQLRIGYNAVPWDGRDEDGDALANGVYFYKIVSKMQDTAFEHIGKLAILK